MHNAGGVRVVDRAEAQLVHDGDRAGTHRDDVANDAAHARRGTLKGLDEGGVVVRLDLEGHRPALADIHDTGVLAHAHHEICAHLLGGLLTELAQVFLRALVGAVLAPHHRVHRELTARGPAAEDLADAQVFALREAECRVGLLALRSGHRVRDCVGGRDGVYRRSGGRSRG